MIRFEGVISDWKPDVLIVVGDVNSTIACALVAAKLGVKVAHVEAGLRSFDRGMPEEINRVLTDAISDYLFVSEPSGVENLRREGVDPEKIFLVGNVMIDSLQRFLPVAQRSDALMTLGLAERGASNGRVRPYVLVTLHRPSNVDDEATLAGLVDALMEVGKNLPVIFPVHPRTVRNMQQAGLTARLRTGPPACEPGVWILPPAGYLDFLHLLSEASMVLTDSGGIQEESTVLGVPCLTLRDNTERPITVDEGTNLLVGQRPDKIVDAAREILAGRSKRGRVPSLWDGHASERVVEILTEKLAVSVF
jgi:UDP-N-acetylglucosamine 2-epimerase (non-hydrolysing)